MTRRSVVEPIGRPQSQVRRQWSVLTSLVSVRYGFTLEQLASRARVSARTIRRDLEVLAEAGFPIERNHEGEGIAIRFVWGAEMPHPLRRLVDRAVDESRDAKLAS